MKFAKILINKQTNKPTDRHKVILLFALSLCVMIISSSVCGVLVYKHFDKKSDSETVISYNNYVFDGETYYTELSEFGSKKIEIGTNGKVNPTYPLYIPTYDGGNQSMHPKMIYFKEPWNKYKFWYVTTPYKGFDDFIENPCVYVSNDGINFEPLANAQPLDAITGDKKEHFNSDPHIVYNSDKNQIECWWRHSKTELSGDKRETIYRSVTKDGLVWSKKEMVFESIGTETAVVSPAVIYEDSIYKIWASHSNNDNREDRCIYYYESKNGYNWKLIRKINLASDIFNFSHLDVIHTDKGYEMVVQAIHKDDGSELAGSLEQIMYTVSLDNIKYEKPVSIIERGNKGQWDDWRMYRPSLTKVDDKYYLYYGATSSNYDWGTGLIIFDDIEQLSSRLK